MKHLKEYTVVTRLYDETNTKFLARTENIKRFVAFMEQDIYVIYDDFKTDYDKFMQGFNKYAKASITQGFDMVNEYLKIHNYTGKMEYRRGLVEYGNYKIIRFENEKYIMENLLGYGYFYALERPGNLIFLHGDLKNNMSFDMEDTLIINVKLFDDCKHSYIKYNDDTFFVCKHKFDFDGENTLIIVDSYECFEELLNNMPNLGDNLRDTILKIIREGSYD